MLYFFVASIALSSFQYINQLQRSLKVSNEASATILNGMHEGVLILNAKKLEKEKREGKVLFCNWPAQKVLTTFLGEVGSEQKDLLDKLIFEPIKGNTYMSFLTKSEASAQH